MSVSSPPPDPDSGGSLQTQIPPRWRWAGIALTAVALVVLALVAAQSQPHPPTLVSDDAWQLLGWKMDRLIDFRRAAYTAFGFVLLERVVLNLTSFTTEHARWLPMLSMLVIGPEFFLVAIWMRIRYPAALLGAVLLVTSPELLSASSHAKQYTFDVVLAIALLGLAAAITRLPHAGRRWIAFSVASLVALFFSFAVVGIVVAGAIAGLVALWRDPDRTASATRIAVVCTVAGAAFAAGWYGLVLRPVIPFDALTDFWRGAYLDLGNPRHSWSLTRWLFSDAFTLPALVSLAGFLVSALLLVVRRPIHAVLFGIPVVIAIVGSFLQQAPFGTGRTDTWLYAALVFTIASAADLVLELIEARTSNRSWTTASAAVGVVVVVTAVAIVGTATWRDFPGGRDTYGGRNYLAQPDAGPPIARLERLRQPGDLVVLAPWFTYIYPLYSDLALTTRGTKLHTSGWYPDVHDPDILMSFVAWNQGAGPLIRRFRKTDNVWLLDAPNFYGAGTGVRPVLTHEGFELVKRVRWRGQRLSHGRRAPASVLEHWSRVAPTGAAAGP